MVERKETQRRVRSRPGAGRRRTAQGLIVGLVVGLVAVLLCLLSALVGGCRNYYVEDSIRHLACYNALPEPSGGMVLPVSRHEDPLDDPSAPVEGWELGSELGGGFESVALELFERRADTGFFRLGALGLSARWGGGGWSGALGLRREGSFEFALGEDDRFSSRGSLWRGGVALGWGGSLRAGLGLDALFGRRTLDVDGSPPLEDELRGWRGRLGVQLLHRDWRLGLGVLGPARLGVGPGLPWRLELWSSIPLTGFREERFNLGLAFGVRLWPSDAALRDERGLPRDQLLADGVHGALEADWISGNGVRLSLGGAWGTYPLRDPGTNHSLLSQEYALRIALDTSPRWSLKLVYTMIGGRPGDPYHSRRLELSLGLELSP